MKAGSVPSNGVGYGHRVHSEPVCLALDIGGTKMAAGIVSAAGVVGCTARRPTPQRASADELFAAAVAVLADVAAADPDSYSRAVALGVGCGGPMWDFGRLVSPLNISGWRDFPLLERLSDQLGLPVAIDNDAKALALAEGWRGAAVGCADYLAMVVSTGVGAGIVSGGRLLHGASGNAGHIGHVIVEPAGRSLPGHVPGCLEAEVSGVAIEHHHRIPAADSGPDVIAAAGTLVGRAVGSTANLLDLRLGLVGGSVALGFGAPFFAAAQAEIDRICQLDYSSGTTIAPVGLGAQAPLIGAAAVAFDRFELLGGPLLAVSGGSPGTTPDSPQVPER